MKAINNPTALSQPNPNPNPNPNPSAAQLTYLTTLKDPKYQKYQMLRKKIYSLNIMLIVEVMTENI